MSGVLHVASVPFGLTAYYLLMSKCTLRVAFEINLLDDESS